MRSHAAKPMSCDLPRATLSRAMTEPEKTTPEQPFDELVAVSEELCRKLLELGDSMMQVDEGRVFGVDLIAIAAVKRTVTVAAGFRALVREHNYLCAACVLRLQVDTLMRFFALTLVDDPHSLAGRILAGEFIRKIKDRTGKPMTDAYLVERLSARTPWVARVYKETSGFIHLSDKHMLSPVTAVDDDAKTVSFLVHETDVHVRAEHWRELVECFNEATREIGGAISSWTQRKLDVGEERRRHAADPSAALASNPSTSEPSPAPPTA